MKKTLCGFTLPLAYDGEADAVYAGDVLVAELFADEPKLGRMVAAAPELLEVLEGLLGDIEALIGDSSGVYGLHRNGDPAPWRTLQEGGDFAEWLENLPKARALIARLKGETG